MPMTYRIDASRRLVLTSANGVVTDADVMGHKSRLAADAALEVGMPELADMRGIERLAVTADGIRRIVVSDAEDGTAARFGPLAIVASDDLAFGLARMYQNMTEPEVRKVGVFRDFDEALRWLESA